MATPDNPDFLPEADQFDAQIAQLEDGWWPTGGPVDPANNGGLMNWQAQGLANRTRWLKNRIDPLAASNLQVAGLATGGGPINANPTITVPVASQAQAEAGVDNATAMTPLRVAQRVAALLANSTVQAGSAILNAISALAANGFVARTAAGAVAARTMQAGTGISVTNGDGVAGNPTIGVDLASAFASSLAGSGWQRLPSGQIVQWGTYTTAGGTVNVTFPLAFPNAVFRVLVSEAAATGWSGSNVTMHGVGAVSTTGFTARSVTWGGSSFSGSIATGNFWAIGN